MENERWRMRDEERDIWKKNGGVRDIWKKRAGERERMGGRGRRGLDEKEGCTQRTALHLGRSELRGGLRARPRYSGVEDGDDDEDEEEEEEEEGLFKADAVNEEDPERDCATQEEVNQPQ